MIEGILNNTCKFIYHGPNTTQTSTLVQGGGTKDSISGATNSART